MNEDEIEFEMDNLLCGPIQDFLCEIGDKDAYNNAIDMLIAALEASKIE